MCMVFFNKVQDLSAASQVHFSQSIDVPPLCKFIQ